MLVETEGLGEMSKFIGFLLIEGHEDVGGLELLAFLDLFVEVGFEIDLGLKVEVSVVDLLRFLVLLLKLSIQASDNIPVRISKIDRLKRNLCRKVLNRNLLVYFSLQRFNKKPFKGFYLIIEVLNQGIHAY